MDCTMWKSIKNCARKWCPKLCAFLFAATWAFGNMCRRIWLTLSWSQPSRKYHLGTHIMKTDLVLCKYGLMATVYLSMLQKVFAILVQFQSRRQRYILFHFRVSPARMRRTTVLTGQTPRNTARARPTRTSWSSGAKSLVNYAHHKHSWQTLLVYPPKNLRDSDLIWQLSGQKKYWRRPHFASHTFATDVSDLPWTFI